MFDIGWSEMAVIGVVALIVIGPRDLPRVLYTLGRWAGKARGLLRDLQQGMEEIAREAELEDMKKKFDAAKKLDVKREIGNAIDPDGQLAGTLDPARKASSVPHSSSDLEEDEGTIDRRPVAPERPRNPSSDDQATDSPTRPATPS